MTVRIAILAERVGWHNRQLLRYLERCKCSVTTVSLSACAIDTERRPALHIPGFDRDLPDAVLVRSIPAGSFEQITFYLTVLHALGQMGVVVINDARSIERTVDKSMTSLRLAEAGLPTPPTWVCADAGAAQAVINRELRDGWALVQKPLFGSQGEGLRKIETATEQVPGHGELYQGLWYLQRFIEPAARWHDWRVFVVGGRALAAMRREGADWISNVSVGAAVYPATLEPQMRDLAEQAAGTLGVDYAGVDLLRDRDGRWWIVEVNSIPAWRGLQSVCRTPIARHITDLTLARVAGGQGVEAVG